MDDLHKKLAQSVRNLIQFADSQAIEQFAAAEAVHEARNVLAEYEGKCMIESMGGREVSIRVEK